MKWMGFSHQELLDLPDYHWRNIIEMMREEVERLEARKSD
jgi:hypothetical protein